MGGGRKGEKMSEHKNLKNKIIAHTHIPRKKITRQKITLVFKMSGKHVFGISRNTALFLKTKV